MLKKLSLEKLITIANNFLFIITLFCASFMIGDFVISRYIILACVFLEFFIIAEIKKRCCK
ncbi:MAG: hypothetical protein MJH09_07400 [Cetobacterium sp.]|nr:hypothetical protein [Cetobacterium sp.]